MDYLHALHYSAHREDAREIRAHLESVEAEMRAETTAKRRRRLERRAESLRARLRFAETFAAYDWDSGEREFCDFVRNAIEIPGVFERWRTDGVPLRVLREARRRARQA